MWKDYVAYGECSINGKYYCLSLFFTFFIMNTSFTILHVSNIKILNLDHLVCSMSSGFKFGNYLSKKQGEESYFFPSNRKSDKDTLFGF